MFSAKNPKLLPRSNSAFQRYDKNTIENSTARKVVYLIGTRENNKYKQIIFINLLRSWKTNRKTGICFVEEALRYLWQEGVGQTFVSGTLIIMREHVAAFALIDPLRTFLKNVCYSVSQYILLRNVFLYRRP